MRACVRSCVRACVRACIRACVLDLLTWQREHWLAGHSHACASLQRGADKGEGEGEGEGGGSAGAGASAGGSLASRRQRWREWEVCVEEEPEEGEASQQADVQQRLAAYNKRIGLEGAYSLKEVEGIAQVWRLLDGPPALPVPLVALQRCSWPSSQRCVRLNCVAGGECGAEVLGGLSSPNCTGAAASPKVCWRILVLSVAARSCARSCVQS